MRLSRAPGRLDVMGGIADYTGSLVCETPLDRAAAVVMQRRDDRILQIISLNLLDAQQPFVWRMNLDDLAAATLEQLQAGFAQPGMRWAGYIAGCLWMLAERGYVDWRDPAVGGMNLALDSTVPLGGGVSSSAAIEVATMMNLADEFSLRADKAVAGAKLDGLALAALCQRVENLVVKAPCGIMDQVSSCCGQAGALLRMLCQPHKLLGPLQLPKGVRVVGINSAVKHSVGGGHYGITRCAAFMGHALILQLMRQDGAARPDADPTGGYLANLDENDYRKLYRDRVPAQMSGQEFIASGLRSIDTAAPMQAQQRYEVRAAVDHHVFEAARVQRFVQLLEQAAQSGDTKSLEQAGQLMLQSHQSYGQNAHLGAAECDLLVKLAIGQPGTYGAKITGGGSGGTVAVMLKDDSDTRQRVEAIAQEYQRQSGQEPEIFLSSSPGAWEVGTAIVGES